MKVLPDGPKGNFLLGIAREMKEDPLGFFSRCRDEYGDIVPIRIGPYAALFVNEPELIHEVLVTKAQNFSKDAAIKNNREFFGKGLLSSEGNYWKRERKLASPAFSPKKLESYSTTMVDHTYRMLSHWKAGDTFDIQHEMMQLTLGIATKTLFDIELTGDNSELEIALTAAQKYLADRMNDAVILLLPEWVPFPTNIHLHQEIEKVNKVIFKLIKERRGQNEGRQDLLSTFLSVKDEDGSSMSDQEIRDEVFTLFFAGHETTALTLTWTLYLLAMHPQIEKELLAEVKNVLSGRKPTIADYGQLSFTEKVIKESLRIRPPVWAVGRECIEDCLIGDYEIKKGMSIIASQWTMHHDKRHYPNPERFEPSRWTNEFNDSLAKFAYFPFGGGPRTCIGNGFAMIESVLVLASVIQDFNLSLVPNQNIKLDAAVTLRPKHGIQMTINKR